MPIYQYRCDNGHEFEALQKIKDAPLEQCELCSAKAYRRISLFHHPQGAGVYIFDRAHGNADILHDPTFSDRERAQVISDIASRATQQ